MEWVIGSSGGERIAVWIRLNHERHETHGSMMLDECAEFLSGTQ